MKLVIRIQCTTSQWMTIFCLAYATYTSTGEGVERVEQNSLGQNFARGGGGGAKRHTPKYHDLNRTQSIIDGT